jgi:dipeptide transport system ATP-binding protein
VVEEQPAAQLFAPPYRDGAALLSALPERATGHNRLPTIPGVVPGLHDRPTGCLFNPRCRYADARCRAEEPQLDRADGAHVRCHYPLDAPAQAGAAQ